MYYAHFGLNQAPFKITPNTEFFFGGGNRGPVLEALLYAVTHGEGIVKVTGEVGSGKTMLCHMLQARLPAHIDSVYIPNPGVSPEEILRAIAFDLQIDVARDAARLEVMQQLQEFLLKRYAAGRHVVVFVEESQNMPIATLEEIRLLSNLETSNDKLLQIVLFGQPELDENLRQPGIRQLRERITHSFRLEPLNAAEIHEYLMFRMRTAGYKGPDLFVPAVVRRIAAASQGLSRRVNLIADKALLVAFSENTHTIRAKHIDAAVKDSEFSRRTGPLLDPRYAWAAGSLAVGILLGLGAITYFQAGRTARPAPATTGQSAAESNLAEREILKAILPEAASGGVARAEAAGAPTGTPDANVSEHSPSLGTGPKAAGPQLDAAGGPVGEITAEVAVHQPVTSAAAATPPSADAAGAPGQPADSESTLPDDPLEARIAATQEWLAREAPKTYSIQLLGTDNPEQLKSHLKVIAKTIEMNKIFVYRTIAKEKPSLTVLYGSFDDYGAARDALNVLPASLKAYRPILRTVQGIQGEIRRHQTSELKIRSNS